MKTGRLESGEQTAAWRTTAWRTEEYCFSTIAKSQKQKVKVSIILRLSVGKKIAWGC